MAANKKSSRTQRHKKEAVLYNLSNNLPICIAHICILSTNSVYPHDRRLWKKNSYFPTLSRPILSNPILIFVGFFFVIIMLKCTELEASNSVCHFDPDSATFVDNTNNVNVFIESPVLHTREDETPNSYSIFQGLQISAISCVCHDTVLTLSRRTGCCSS